MTIQELAQKTVEALINAGQNPSTAWHLYDYSLSHIVKAHTDKNKDDFDRTVMTDFVHNIEQRFEASEFKKGQYRRYLLGAQRMTEMHDHGKLMWTIPKLTSTFKLNRYFQTILDEYLADSSFSTKGRSDAMWVARKYFSWLVIAGHHDLQGVGACEIQNFMIYCSTHMMSTGVHNVKLYMRKLYRFLAANAYSEDAYEGLFNFRVSRESKMYPATPPDELDKILDVIDRRIPRGKRDYAIILLAAVTGLRAIDIVRLRLTDIDWQAGEIRLVQSKTGKALALPLTADVGKAMQDYILNGRQETESDAVFLRLHVPYQGFAGSTQIQHIYDDYRRMANLPRDARDGKGFHSLRRGVGKNLVTAGVPVETVAQIIGDVKIDSVKKYIALDSHHLKECALDFSGIGKGARKNG